MKILEVRTFTNTLPDWKLTRAKNATREQIELLEKLSKQLRNAYLSGKTPSYIWTRKYTHDLSDLLWHIRFTPEFEAYCDNNGLDYNFEATDIIC